MTNKRGPKPKTNKTPEIQKKDIRHLSSEEAALFQAVAAEGDEWPPITEADMEDFSLMEDPLKIPPEAKKLEKEKKYKFRWIERKPSRIAEIQSMNESIRWKLCNRVNSPWLKDKDFHSIHGGVQILDQILVFRRWDMHVRHQLAKQELADIQDTSALDKRKKEKKDGVVITPVTGKPEDVPSHLTVTGSDDIMDTPDGDLQKLYDREGPGDSSDLGDLVVGE